MLETGAHALGCTVFPAGTGQTEQQVQAIAELAARRLRRHAVVPEDHPREGRRARRRAAVADEGARFRRSVSAEPARRARGARHRGLPGVRDAPTSAAIAYETEAREGLVVDEGVLVEIVRPGTGDPVAPGEVGEVVVTTLFNADYPLIRFGTGDLSAFLPGD